MSFNMSSTVVTSDISLSAALDVFTDVTDNAVSDPTVNQWATNRRVWCKYIKWVLECGGFSLVIPLLDKLHDLTLENESDVKVIAACNDLVVVRDGFSRFLTARMVARDEAILAAARRRTARRTALRRTALRRRAADATPESGAPFEGSMCG